MKARIIVCVALVFPSLGPGVHAAEPSDHPLVGRYEGSTIEAYQERAFDEYVLPLGRYEDGGFAEERRLEGKITWIGYRNPDDRSTLEILRNYQEKLADEGFEELFVCESIDDCGRRFDNRLFEADPTQYLTGADNGAQQEIRYLAAKRDDGEQEIYAQITVYIGFSTVWTRVRVIEGEPRETDKIVVKADEMAREIGESGSVALYGIHFDYDKATLKPESEPTLKEIAKLLENDADLNLLVVGHTDNQGDFEYNRDLSERRAAAVVEALADEYGVARERLEPHGVAFLAPVASNATEDGRAENRRVELVDR